jgi:membrane-associated phospholipid phosphatase
MDNRKPLQAWYLALVAAMVAIWVSVRWIDYPVAAKFLHISNKRGLIGYILGGRVLVTGELSLIAILALVRIRTGHLSDMAKTLLVACSASVLSYTLNDLLLKVVFGRQNPSDYFQSHLPGTFHLFLGDDHSSFPSGHMMLAAAFLGVFFRVYARLRIPSLFLLLFGTVVLVLGDWHFVSDVIAGAFLGLTIGLVAGELWLRHTRRAA